MSSAHHDDYDDLYRQGEDALPWEIGRPQPALADVAERESLGERVLDVGCGTGELARHLARRGHRVVGLDMSPAAIDIARRRATDESLDVTFVVGDARELSTSAPGPFDAVVDSGLLHSLAEQDQPRYVDELHAVCAAGARVHVLAMSADGEAGWGLTPSRLTALFTAPRWTATRVAPTLIHAQHAGESLELAAFVLTTTRAA